MSWIKIKSIKDLPKEHANVLAKTWDEDVVIASVEIGITEKQREKMRAGVIHDPETTFVDCFGNRYFNSRSSDKRRSDEGEFNPLPYCWIANTSKFFKGDEITHWMPLPP